MLRLISILILLVSAAGWNTLCAQPRRRAAVPPHAMFERFNRMTPEQKERALSRLSPERRRNFEQRLEQYNRMTPEQRQRLREDLETFDELSPEAKAEARRLIRRFMQFPEDRRALLRTEFQDLRAMNQEERRSRFASEDFRSRFRPPERRLLERLAAILPPPD